MLVTTGNIRLIMPFFLLTTSFSAAVHPNVIPASAAICIHIIQLFYQNLNSKSQKIAFLLHSTKKDKSFAQSNVLSLP